MRATALAVSGGGDGLPERPMTPGELSPADPVDMSEEGQARALAYSGDASWESIRILREDIMRSMFERLSRGR